MKKQYKLASLLCILSCLFWSVSAIAQSDELDFGEDANEDILFQDIASVYSASKYEQKVTEAPARISNVTAKEIQRYGYRTLPDILNSLPGFYMTNDRNYGYSGARGFSITGDYSTKFLQLVDGHRINDNLYDSAFIDRSFIVDLDLIDRVEVVRDPSSSLYGNSAFFGVINVITKKGRDLQMEGRPDILGGIINAYLGSSEPLIAGLKEALIVNDLKVLQNSAHSLKSSSANVGAIKLSEISKELEMDCRNNTLENATDLVSAIELEFIQVKDALNKEIHST